MPLKHAFYFIVKQTTMHLAVKSMRIRALGRIFDCFNKLPGKLVS